MAQVESNDKRCNRIINDNVPDDRGMRMLRGYCETSSARRKMPIVGSVIG